MDWTSIVVAVLAFLGTLAGSALGIRQSNKVVELRLDTLDDKMDNMEKKMDKYNDVVERVAIVESDIKSHDRRIGDLESVLPRVTAVAVK